MKDQFHQLFTKGEKKIKQMGPLKRKTDYVPKKKGGRPIPSTPSNKIIRNAITWSTYPQHGRMLKK